MIAVAYFLPVIACIVLHFVFGYTGDWTTYMWLVAAGEATVAGLHYLSYSSHTSSREYLGSLVASVHYEESWTELVQRVETRTDRNGRTYTVRRIHHRYHPERFYFYTTRGTVFNADREFFVNVGNLWRVPRREDSWAGTHIRGGVRYGCHYTIDDFQGNEFDNPRYWIPITESHSYRNKIRCSNSIFKFERISSDTAEEWGLYDYPPIIDCDTPCILSAAFNVPDDVQLMFRRFNARYAPQVQMRLYILLFEADKGIAVSEMQRAYWQGGNKNEFVVCIGLTPEGTVAWARAFSWADEQTVEVDTARWLMDHPELDWKTFHNWLVNRITDWRRKEFADFDYINVTLPVRYILGILLAGILENALAIYLILK